MNSQFSKWLVSFAVFFCLVCFSSTAVGKKPGNQPPKEGDPCASMETFSSDFAFWKYTGRQKNPKITIYIGDSSTGCDLFLADVSIKEVAPILDTDLNFSTWNDPDDDSSTLSGRVVYSLQKIGKGPTSVWMHEFKVREGVMSDPGEPLMILENPDVDNRVVQEIALSNDGRSLVYKFYNRADELGELLVYIEDIASCLPPAENPCQIGESSDEDVLASLPPTAGAYSSPVWGPADQRIYLIRRDSDDYFLEYVEPTTRDWATLVTISNTPGTWGEADYRAMRRVSSGIEPDCASNESDCELLAIQIAKDTYRSTCAYVHLANVNECAIGAGADDACLGTAEFAGLNPSWTRNGEIIHSYLGWTFRANRDICTSDTVGRWDSQNLESLIDGLEPNAAGGLPVVKPN